jgi:hypothetical protein
MADLAEVFRVIADDTTGEGEPLISRTEGEVAAAKAGSIGFAFKDSSGNVILPQLDSLGRLPTTEVAGTCKYQHGELAAGSSTTVKVTGAEIALTAGKVYTNIGFTASCLRTSIFELVHIDDEGVTDTEVVLEEIIVGPGAFFACCQLNCREIDTTGGTGVIVLTVRAKNFAGAPTALSSLRASVSCLEAA